MIYKICMKYSNKVNFGDVLFSLTDGDIASTWRNFRNVYSITASSEVCLPTCTCKYNELLCRRWLFLLTNLIQNLIRKQNYINRFIFTIDVFFSFGTRTLPQVFADYLLTGTSIITNAVHNIVEYVIIIRAKIYNMPWYVFLRCIFTNLVSITNRLVFSTDINYK